MLTHIHSV